MRRHFVSGFPRALLSLSQEKSSGVEIARRLENSLQLGIKELHMRSLRTETVVFGERIDRRRYVCVRRLHMKDHATTLLYAEMVYETNHI